MSAPVFNISYHLTNFIELLGSNIEIMFFLVNVIYV